MAAALSGAPVAEDQADSTHLHGEFSLHRSACEDSCCLGWRVDIDEATYAKYHSVAAGPLRAAIDANFLRTAEDAGGSKPKAFAHVKMLPSLRCPFHTAEQLCQIQWNSARRTSRALCQLSAHCLRHRQT